MAEITAIMKVSEITPAIQCEYMGIDYNALNDNEKTILETLLNVASEYISNYTGIPKSSTDGTKVLDDYPDFPIVVFILVADMWDNGSLYVEKNTINNTVDCILGAHRRNLL